MKRLMCFIAILLMGLSGLTNGQDSVEDLMNMDLEEMLNMQINVATGAKSLTSRESPGIITVVTAEDIRNSGARDLMDILYRVPGFYFGTDVEGVENIGFRGNWAHEGKMLLIWDGVENNELSYSTLILGNHYPVDQIKRIEIIRGPGSAIYGGNAELGVINIVTKNAEDIDGLAFTAVYGQLADTYRRKNISLSAGKKLGDLGLTLHGFFGQGNKSDKSYSDLNGDAYNLKDNASQNPLMLNLGAVYKGLTVRAIADRFTTTQRDMFAVNIPAEADALTTRYHAYHASVKYQWQVNDQLMVTPALRFRRHYSYNSADDDVNKILAIDPESDALYMYDRYTQRLTGELTMGYDLNPDVNVLVGAQAYQESAHAHENPEGRNNFAGPNKEYDKDEISFSDVAAFFQALIKTSFLNITAGGRYDTHSEGANAFVPRLGLTRVFSDRYHAKVLLSQAFRTPSLINVDLNSNIQPEKTTVVELEGGIKVNNKTFLTANIFDITINDPIVYVLDDEGESYKNFDKTGSQGFELEFRFQSDWNHQVFSYSFYTAENKDIIADYRIPNTESPDAWLQDQVLAFPKHKFCMNSTYFVSSRLTLNTNLVYQSKVYALRDENIEVFNFTILDMYVSYRYFGIKGLELGLGVYNLFNSDYYYIQPYQGGHNPIPGMGREILFRINWRT